MEYFALIDNIPIHISDTKKGDTVIFLLHGYLETLYIFTEFAELFSPQYRIISIDLPGHGLSGSNKDINTMEFAAGIVMHVMDQSGIKQAYIAGHSMGGYIAQACIKSDPDRFEGLILLNSTPYADSPEKKADRDREIELIRSAKLISLATLSIPKMYASENLRTLDNKIQETIEICEVHDPNGIVACLKGMMAREDCTELLGRMKVPGLFVFGDRDKFISLERASELIARYPHFESAVIPGTGHNSFIEAPDKVHQAVMKFIADNRAKASPSKDLP